MYIHLTIEKIYNMHNSRASHKVPQMLSKIILIFLWYYFYSRIPYLYSPAYELMSFDVISKLQIDRMEQKIPLKLLSKNKTLTMRQPSKTMENLPKQRFVTFPCSMKGRRYVTIEEINTTPRPKLHKITKKDYLKSAEHWEKLAFKCIKL